MGRRLWLIEQRADHVSPRSSTKWDVPGRHLIQHHAEREDVTAMIHSITTGLLRRHRDRGSYHGAGHRQMGFGFTFRLLQKLCQPKVEHLRLPARRDDDVL